MISAALKLTLAVPCYNGAEYIPLLVQSLASQRGFLDQVIFIDDGSNDNSRDHIGSCSDIEVHSHARNLGLAEARNTALLAATGDVILFIDCDTTLPPGCIEVIRRLYQVYPEATGIGGSALEINHLLPADRYRSEFLRQSFGPNVVFPVSMLWGVCSSYRRKALLRMGGFDPRFRTNAEDVELGLRLTGRGARLLYHPGLYVHHHKQDSCASVQATAYRWYYWGAKAHLYNGHNPLPGMARNLVREYIQLKCASHDPLEYRRLCRKMLITKASAVLDACLREVKPRF
ncbi:glycosyltransferase [bacterium]|nr:glycosyltransferase [bacterium]